MPVEVVRPRGRSGLLIDAHPTGCERTVEEMAEEAEAGGTGDHGGKVALIVGSSAGYGLAATIAGLVGHGIRGVGLCYERPATGSRTASAGWYRTRAVAELARSRQLDVQLLNGDCFLPETKRRVLDEVRTRFGRVDYLIYSVAAPARTDPRTGVTHRSAVKPLGQPYATSSLSFDDDGRPRVARVEVAPATEPELAATVKVMGGEDWAAWVGALASEALLADGFQTVALSYVGSALTAPIYRQGTIGRAKDHLERTARRIERDLLRDCHGTATTSVNGAAVTQASMAIPGIALYATLLRSVLGEAMWSPVRQSVRLWDHLTGRDRLPADESGRLRLDGWELAPDVQAQVTRRWDAIDTERLPHEAAAWFHDQFLRLYGFGVKSVDYAAPVEVDLPWPEPARQPYRVVSRAERFSGPVFRVVTDQLEMPDGQVVARDYLHHVGAVGVVALDERDRVVLVRQYRHAVGGQLWELPAGLVDAPGEELPEVAARELAEETDLRAGTIEPLIELHPSPGVSDERIKIYLARDLSPAARPHRREHEEATLAVARFPLGEAVQMVFDGQITNAAAVAGILAAARAREGT
jgi:enoyl-[acyl-carrier protein] reductase / trans-2-enoyl-CoA reductase (NAD+)